MPQKFLRLIVLICLIFCAANATGLASEKVPRQIAIVPTIIQSSGNYQDIIAYCDNALLQELRIPLNSILNVHAYIPKENIFTALPELKQPNKSYQLTPSRLKEAADSLSADLIVGFVVSEISEFKSYNWNGDIICYTAVDLLLIGYDRQKAAFINLKQREYFHGEDAPAGSPLSLAQLAADKLLKKADFKKDIFPLSDNY